MTEWYYWPFQLSLPFCQLPSWFGSLLGYTFYSHSSWDKKHARTIHRCYDIIQILWLSLGKVILVEVTRNSTPYEQQYLGWLMYALRILLSILDMISNSIIPSPISAPICQMVKHECGAEILYLISSAVWLLFAWNYIFKWWGEAA